MIFSTKRFNPAHLAAHLSVVPKLRHYTNTTGAIVRSTTKPPHHQNDVQGEFSDFTMVIPVPSVLPEDAIHVIDPAVFDSLNSYSPPFVVMSVRFDYSYNEDFGVSEVAAPGMDTGGFGVSVEASSENTTS